MLNSVEFWKFAATGGLWFGLGLTILGALFGGLAGFAGLKLGAEADKAIASANAAAEHGRATAETAKVQSARAGLAAAQAEERAAEARQKAAELELQAAELKERLSNVRNVFAAREISPEQEKILVERLRGHYEEIAITYRDGDMDSKFYTMDWMRVFENAGIRSRVVPVEDGATYQGPPPGVAVFFPQGDIRDAAKQPLWQALEEAGLWGGGGGAEAGPAAQYGVPTIQIPSRTAPRIKAIEAGLPKPMKGS